MSKIIKLTQTDIENMVKRIIKENDFDDFDTNISPEEMMGSGGVGVELTLAQDPDTGEYYVLKNGESENPEVVAKTK
jgi:hypothetical protein